MSTEKPIINPAPPVTAGQRFFDRLRRHFAAGLFVLVPGLIAVWAVLFIMDFAAGIFGGVVDHVLATVLPQAVLEDPYLLSLLQQTISFLLACTIVTAIGWLSTFFLIRRFIRIAERLVNRLPVIKFFYNTPKEVINTFARTKKGGFKRVVMVEYPIEGVWALAFLTCELVRQPGNVRLAGVFMPTTPNPTTGFLMYLPFEKVLDTALTVEEGARLVISGGLLTPEALHTQPFRGVEVEPVFPPEHLMPPPPESRDEEEEGG